MNSPLLNKILLVEDEDDIRTIAKFTLEKYGKFKVEGCSSGEEALVLTESYLPDLILLDMMMPVMDGIETFKALKAKPKLKNIPVIFMTAKVQTHEIQQYKSMGVLGVITKPFSAVTLSDEIKTLWESQYEHSG